MRSLTKGSKVNAEKVSIRSYQGGIRQYWMDYMMEE